MRKAKRRVLWLTPLVVLVLVVLALSTFTVVSRHKNTLRLVEVVKQDDKADEDEVRFLLAGGADPNASLTPKPFTMMDMLRTILHQSQQRDLGKTVVLHAAGSCNVRVLGALLDAGGSANTTDGDQTALVSAILGSRHHNVEVLVQHGAELNLSSPRGSPLIVAVVEDNVDDLSFLLDQFRL